MISGCAHEAPKVQYVYVSVPLEHSSRPPLPKVTVSDLSCLSDQTKGTLARRDTLQKGYIDELEAIIDSTKK